MVVVKYKKSFSLIFMQDTGIKPCRRYSLHNQQMLNGQSPESALWKKAFRARCPGIPGISGPIFWMNANFQTRKGTFGTGRAVPDK